MDPLRKHERFEDEKLERFKAKFNDAKFKNEEFPDEDEKPTEVSQSAELEREERPDANPEPHLSEPTAGGPSAPAAAERLAVPMGPMPAVVPPKGEAQGAGPRLVSKESKTTGEAKASAFFTEREQQEMRARWDKIQGAFVDQPRQAVEDADNLIGEAIKKLTEQCANERSSVIKQWNSGDNVSTEILRQSLRRYRTFFDRLIAA